MSVIYIYGGASELWVCDFGLNLHFDEETYISNWPQHTHIHLCEGRIWLRMRAPLSRYLLLWCEIIAKISQKKIRNMAQIESKSQSYKNIRSVAACSLHYVFICQLDLSLFCHSSCSGKCTHTTRSLNSLHHHHSLMFYLTLGTFSLSPDVQIEHHRAQINLGLHSLSISMFS